MEERWIMGDETRWLKIGEAADRARCGPKTIYRAVRSGQLRAARIGGRRELRFLAAWIDAWLIGAQEGPELNPAVVRRTNHGEASAAAAEAGPQAG